MQVRGRHIISLYRDSLNEEGHDLIDTLTEHFSEKDIRRALSRHLGMHWRGDDPASGFHFSGHHPIAKVEAAVEFLRQASATKRLKPPNQKQLPPMILPQAAMRRAIASLPRPKPLAWWRRILSKLSAYIP